MKKLIWLFFILLLAFFLRFYQLDQNPPSLNWDEVSHGYNAYSILKTGADEWGVSWPLVFKAYGDYKLPVYIYSTVLSIKAFGLNDWAVRLPSALTGVFSVLLTYFLFKKLFKNYLGACLASLFLAISSWHLFLSRAAFEANLASFLVIGGVYFFLLGLEKKWLLPLSIFLLGLSVHTYYSARIFTPLILILLFFLYRIELFNWFKKRKKESLLTGFLLLLFFVPLVISFVSPQGWARFKWVSVLDQGAINRINMARGSSQLSEPLPRLVHNKATYFTLAYAKNYFSNFSPNYLFFKGGSNYQYNIPGEGIIYPILIPLILLGLYWLWRNRFQKGSKLILAWWLLAIVPAAATQENPHVLRTILVLPVPYLLAALGFGQIWLWLKKQKIWRWILALVFSLILIFSFLNFWRNYFGFYRQNYSWSWQYGYQQAATYIEKNYNKYERILITKKYGEPHEFLLFYLKWNPEKYQQDLNLKRYFQTDWYWVDSFDKFIFINDWEVKQKAKCDGENIKCLLLTSPGNYSEGWKKIETINFLDGQPVFEILEW